MISFSMVLPIYTWDNYGNMFIKGYYRTPIYYYLEGSAEGTEYFHFNNLMSGYVLSDDLFNGREKTLYAKISTWQLFDYYYQDLPQSPLYIHLYSISEDLYRFILTYNKYTDALGNPFAEPVNIYSNVKNGLGIFSGVNVSTDSVDLTSIGKKIIK